jgi:hypothetical protein
MVFVHVKEGAKLEKEDRVKHANNRLVDASPDVVGLSQFPPCLPMCTA